MTMMRNATVDAGERTGTAPSRDRWALAAGASVVATLLAALGLACPTSTSGPCTGVGCSDHGICTTVGDAAYCVCAAGFHPRGFECVANDSTNPCRDVDCSGHGACRAVAGSPTCDCAPGWEHLSESSGGCAGGGCELFCVAVVVRDADAGEEGEGGAGDEAGTETRDDGGAPDDATPPPPVENCANGVDDDGDTQADCADPECDGRTCSGGRTCRGGACGCPGGDTESNCQDGADNDCDTAADCADGDCNGRVCANDGSMCGSPLQCHICAGGSCVVNDPHYDGSCNPSCGAAQSLCGRPTFCCAAGAACLGGTPDRSYGCGTCCFDGCCSGPETACADGADNDCDTAADCADPDCEGLSCGTGRCYLGSCCSPDPDPCSWCECGRPDDGCGGLGTSCGRCIMPDTCVDCYCEPGAIP